MKVYNLYNNTILIPYLTMENQPKCKIKAIKCNLCTIAMFKLYANIHLFFIFISIYEYKNYILCTFLLI